MGPRAPALWRVIVAANRPASSGRPGSGVGAARCVTMPSEKADEAPPEVGVDIAAGVLARYRLR